MEITKNTKINIINIKDFLSTYYADLATKYNMIVSKKEHDIYINIFNDVKNGNYNSINKENIELLKKIYLDLPDRKKLYDEFKNIEKLPDTDKQKEIKLKALSIIDMLDIYKAIIDDNREDWPGGTNFRASNIWLKWKAIAGKAIENAETSIEKTKEHVKEYSEKLKEKKLPKKETGEISYNDFYNKVQDKLKIIENNIDKIIETDYNTMKKLLLKIIPLKDYSILSSEVQKSYFDSLSSITNEFNTIYYKYFDTSDKLIEKKSTTPTTTVIQTTISPELLNTLKEKVNILNTNIEGTQVPLFAFLQASVYSTEETRQLGRILPKLQKIIDNNYTPTDYQTLLLTFGLPVKAYNKNYNFNIKILSNKVLEVKGQKEIYWSYTTEQKEEANRWEQSNKDKAMEIINQGKTIYNDILNALKNSQNK